MLKSDNNIPIPNKEFYDVGIVVDNYKLNAFSKALGKGGKNYHLEIFPFTHDATTLKVMQVPKADMEELAKLIKKLNNSAGREN